MLLRLLIGWLIFVVVGVAGSIGAESRLTVAVLYFDNNSGKPELEVFKKGLADMLITDLAEVEGITVVERDKLEAVLAELKLQRSKYFDPRTAVRVGKGLGARYALAGSIQALTPRVRIDVRLVDVATGKVVLTSKATGKQGELFEVEQKLVAALAAKIRRRFSPGSSARKVDVDTVIAYSRALDQADRGQLERAKKTMDRVMRQAPTFALARVRRAELIRRHEARKQQRAGEMTAEMRAVFERANAYLGSHRLAKLSKADAILYMAHRAQRGFYLGTALARHLKLYGQYGGGLGALEPGDRRGKKLLADYLDNLEAGIREFQLFQKRFAGNEHIFANWRVGDAEYRKLRRAGFDGVPHQVLDMGDGAWAKAVLNGEIYTGHSQHQIIYVAPVPVHLWSKRSKATWSRLRAAKKRLQAHKGQHYATHSLGAIADAEAQYWIWRGDVGKAVSALQARIDAFGPGHWATVAEGQIQELLGIKGKKHRQLGKRELYRRGLPGCDARSIDRGGKAEMSARLRLRGLAGLRSVVNEVERACKKDPVVKMAAYRDAMYLSADVKRCREFEHWRGKVAAGLKEPSFGTRRGRAAGCNR
jgi:TolB-like protein